MAVGGQACRRHRADIAKSEHRSFHGITGLVA
jgi:hypothetical protein